jgi:polysaccharide export outer membrane protein
MSRAQRPSFTTLALVGGITALVTACAGPPSGTFADPTAQTASTGQEYVIGSGDTLSVFVYQSPELSAPDVPVRPDGKISIPLVQDIQAAGRTPRQLAIAIEGRLRKYVRDPIVTVMVRNFVGPLNRQIKVIGQAVEPAAIPYRDNMTLLDVMIDTKGLTKYAAGNRAVIIRREPGGRDRVIHVHLDDLIKDGDISQNVAMRPGDTLIIPETWF